MKHLLIILLSTLLLSSPVIGNNHKGETLYLWKTSSGLVWKGFGDKETHPVYKGQLENGKPNGLGVLIYPNGWKYVGEFKDGQLNGQGTETFSGKVYTGEWVKGEKHGQGQMIHSHKILYGHKEVGEWKNNKPWNTENFDEEGKIIIKTKNGSKICHKWKLPKCSK